MDIKNDGYLHEIAFNTNGDKMVICSSSQKILFFTKKKPEPKMKKRLSTQSSLSTEMKILKFIDESEWNSQPILNIEIPVLRIKWSNPKYGNIIAICGFDKKIMLWKEEKEKFKPHTKILEFSDNVEDISFCPKENGLKLAAVTLNGMLKIFEPSSYIDLLNWDCIYYKDINKLGCTCLCWNPSSFDPQSLIIGCKINKNNIDESKCNLLQILTFNEYKKQFNIHKLEGCHFNDITDVEWATQFGRNYHLIASTSLDMKLVVWEVNLIIEKKMRYFDETKIKYIPVFIYHHNKPLWRCSFNKNGQFLSCIDDNGKVILFQKNGRSKFQMVKICEN
jgi:WD40 repeat protein